MKMGTDPFSARKRTVTILGQNIVKRGLHPFSLLFLLRKKDAYKHVDLVQDLP